MFEGLGEYGRYNGQICQIPYGISTNTMFYNKELAEAAGLNLEENAPKTWADFLEVCKTLKAYYSDKTDFIPFVVSDEDWLTKNPLLSHERSREFASYIMEAMETNQPYKIGGNVINTGLITNLPQNACVEVPCLVDGSGVTPCYVGDLPEQCAALNRTNINVQLLTIEAAKTLKKDYIYQAALMDPHLQSELSIDDIVSLCDDMIEAHKGWLPEYK